MTPALMPGDRVVITACKETSVSRGGLVVIRFRHRPAPLINRAVAIPSDTVEIDGSRLVVNGEEVGEVDPVKMKSTLKQLERNGWIVPHRTLFVLGDNPNNSRDSRRLGLIPVDLIWVEDQP